MKVIAKIGAFLALGFLSQVVALCALAAIALIMSINPWLTLLALPFLFLGGNEGEG